MNLTFLLTMREKLRKIVFSQGLNRFKAEKIILAVFKPCLTSWVTSSVFASNAERSPCAKVSFSKAVTKTDSKLDSDNPATEKDGTIMTIKKNGVSPQHRLQRTRLNESHYTIGDLAREFNITLRTLRFYEDRGLLAPRREGTTRLYDAKDRARLSVILKGKHLGFTLTEIRTMIAVEEQGSETAPDLRLDLEQIKEQISHLEAQRDDIDRALAELKAHQSRLTKEMQAGQS
jgi:DNA-binding transcriptional MerR regulator